jgi:hypothetical protein
VIFSFKQKNIREVNAVKAGQSIHKESQKVECHPLWKAFFLVPPKKKYLIKVWKQEQTINNKSVNYHQGFSISL